MSPEQTALVKDTWRQVEPIADAAALSFYDRLFEIDAEAAALFQGADLAGQRRKLVAALTVVVHGLDDLEALVPMLTDLGRRHALYGVTDGDYETVGRALMWTLEKGLGVAWTPVAADAWAEAYAKLAEVMRGSSAGTPARR